MADHTPQTRENAVHGRGQQLSDHSEPGPQTQHRIELFVRLIGLHQQQIHRYVLSLVPNQHDADDLLQNTNLFLWREFVRFEEGSNFVAWACAVAYHEVLAWRKKKSRDKLVFSESFLAEVSSQLIAHGTQVEQRAELLSSCMAQLPTHHRELLKRRYSQNHSVPDIASDQGRTEEAVYRMLSRIRQALFDCVNRGMKECEAL